MDLAVLIDYINLHIKPNGNREITANVLNPVLQAIADWANTQMGNLEDLSATDKTNLVAAINEVNAALAAINVNGSQVYYGTANPNVTPPPVFKAGDFYVQEDLFNVTVALFVYDGFTWRNLSGSTDTDPVRVWKQGDARITLKDQAYVNANFDSFGIGINNEVGWKIADFPNCVPVQQGDGVFANLGDTFGSKDAVNISHDHTSAVLSDGDFGVNDLGTGTADDGYVLVGAEDNANIVKTSTEGVSGTDKNIQPSYVVLYLECLQDIWASGGSLPSLPNVLNINGRLVENWDTVTDGSGYFVLDDLSSYTLFFGGASINAVITDDLFPMSKGVELQGCVNDSIVTMIWNGGANSLVIDATGTFIKYTAHQTEANIWSFGLSSDSLGGSVTPSSLISTDADNALVLGTDNKLFVPESTGGGVESVTGANVDNTDPLNPIVNDTPINASGGGTTIADGVIEHNDLVALGSVSANGRTKLSQNIADTEAGLYDVSGDRQIATYSENDGKYYFGGGNFTFNEATSEFQVIGAVVRTEPYNDARYVQQGVDDPTTVVLTSSDLNTNYPSAITGFRVYCADIIVGAMVYEKTPSGWIGTACIIP